MILEANWVPCKEDLPPYNTKVLVAYGYQPEIMELRYLDIKVNGIPQHFKFWAPPNCEYAQGEFADVTHWMKLPAGVSDMDDIEALPELPSSWLYDDNRPEWAIHPETQNDGGKCFTCGEYWWWVKSNSWAPTCGCNGEI